MKKRKEKEYDTTGTSRTSKLSGLDGVMVSMQKLLRGGHGFTSNMEHCFI